MKKHFQTTLAILATSLAACAQQNPEQPNFVLDDAEKVTCTKEAPIDSHIKEFECRPVSKINVGSDSTAISPDPGQPVTAAEGACGSE